jgi:hypothetical protein
MKGGDMKKAPDNFIRSIYSEDARNSIELNPSPILNPIHGLNQGSEILEEIGHQIIQMAENFEHFEVLEDYLEQISENHGDDLLDFVILKFGIVTSGQESQSLFVMSPAQVAERILERFHTNPKEFQMAFDQVIQEELKAADHARQFDLQDFEDRVYSELEELVYLSNNPALFELIQFVDDLDAIFHDKSYLFSFLEHRYAQHFGLPNLTAQYLSVQICLDYLTYREQYQLGIIAEYEKLMKLANIDPLQNFGPLRGQNPFDPNSGSTLQ